MGNKTPMANGHPRSERPTDRMTGQLVGESIDGAGCPDRMSVCVMFRGDIYFSLTKIKANTKRYPPRQGATVHTSKRHRIFVGWLAGWKQ